MKSTPIFKLPYPEETDPPDGAAQIEAAVKRMEVLLEAIEGLVTGAPAPGQLIVVNGTSDPVYREATGDIAINSTGVATIANLAVTAAKIAGEAVETAKLKGEAVTEAKLAALAVAASKIAAEAIETGKIKNLAVTEAKIAAGAVTDAKLWSPNNGTYKAIREGSIIFPGGTAANSVRYMVRGGGEGLAGPIGIGANGADVFSLNYLDYEVQHKETKIFLRGNLVSCNVAPASKYKLRIWPVKEIVAGAIVLEAEPALLVETAEPAKNTIKQLGETEVAATKFRNSPINFGLFVATVENLSATTAAAPVVLSYALSYRNI